MELRAETEDACSSASTPIDSSNIGFRLLKKHGWKEGTGLGISEQVVRVDVLSPSTSSIGLEPIQAYVKKNKRGLGADKPKKAGVQSIAHDAEEPKVSKKKAKGISKKMKKTQEFEKQLEEKEFERAFFREFWPENV